MSADECEHQSTVDSIILQNSFWKERAIRSAAPNHSMDANHARHGRVPRVHSADMRSAWRLIANRIVLLKGECVVTRSIRPKCGIIVRGAECKWSAAAPPAHHLRGKELLVCCASSAGLQVSPKPGNALVQLAEDN